jgi:hypothetical protein
VEINLTQEFDAQIWAKEFMRIVIGSGKPITEEWMFTWFANAIMAGYDNHRWKHEHEIARLKNALKEIEGLPIMKTEGEAQWIATNVLAGEDGK